MYFHTLGGVAATRDGEELPLGGPKQRLILALLLCAPGRLVPTDRLVESVWHDEPPSDPRGSVQVYVSNLRRVLGDVELEHRGEGYVLHVSPSQVDAAQFEELVEDGAALVGTDPGRAATVLREALALWRGRPFGGLGDDPALAMEVARLEELRLRALEARIDADLQLGRHDDVVGQLAELTSQHPLRERFWAQLVLARYRSGRQAEALDAYETARETLAERLGIDPSPFLQQLHTQVLRQDPAIDAPSSPTPSPEAIAAGAGAGDGTVRGYELLDELGSGWLGVVFRARQPSVERDVAIKVIRAELANDPEFVRCFEAEAQRVAQLEHPHIVPLYDYWREPDAAYLVMRWLRGGSLAHALREGGWSLEASVGLIEQVAAALDYGHRHGVLHLAVKPTNILLDLDRHAYLSDFGLARYADAPPAGTSSWVSPEHLDGQPLTPATDIFALGLVAFELLTGRDPLAGESPATLADRVRHQPLPALRAHRPDLPEGVEAVLRQATAPDPRRRPHTASELVQALRAEVGVASAQTSPTRVVRNPYKGLHAFSEADSGDFFGREQLVAHLLERLDGTSQRSRVVTVVGPSGSGKSSLVRAGLVPALRQGGARGSERWFVATMRPGTHPLAELEGALTEVAACDRDELNAALVAGEEGLARAVERALPADGSELLLVVDQFEELFSLAGGDQRRQFAACLKDVATHADRRVRVVVTIRADFYDHPLLDPDLGEIVAATTLAVPALSAEELERAIAEPAAAVGVRPHPELITQITGDVASTPAALPLLQYALTELFDRRSGDALTLEGYRAIGGVHGALAGRAEQLYASLDPAAQEACRQLCLRLVTVTDRHIHVRRRVRRDELAGLTPDDTIDHVIETLGRHRLLTFDRDPVTRAPTVEMAHEALLDAWDRLRGWIEQSRTDLRMQHRLAAALEEWAASGYDEAYLLHGNRLEEFDEWARHCQVVLTTPERELLEASRAAEAARQERERARREREQRLERRALNRLRAVATISVVAALAAAGLSMFAFYQRDEAAQQQRLATARGLATAAVAALDDDPELSILLGREAVRVTREADGIVTPDAETALRRALSASRVRQRQPGGGALSVDPDGRIATLAAGGSLSVWDPEEGQRFELAGQFGTSVGPPGDVAADAHDIDFSPDGTEIVAVDFSGRGVIVETTGDGEVRAQLDGQLTRPRFGPDGELVAGVLAGDGEHGPPERTVGVWEVTTGELVGAFRHLANIRAHAFSPDGTRLLTAADDSVRLREIDTGDTDWVVAVDDLSSVASAAFHPDGDRVALGSDDGRVRLRDPETGDRLETLTGHPSPVRSVAFSEPDGQRLVTAAGDEAWVWDVAARARLVPLRGHTDTVTGAAFTGGGDRVVTTSADDTTRVWDVSGEGGSELGMVPAAPGRGRAAAAFSPEGRHLAVSGADGAVGLWEVATTQEALTLDPDSASEPAHAIAYSGDGQALAAAAARAGLDRLHVWDATSGDRRATDSRLGAISDLALTHDGSLLASGGEAGDVQVAEVDSDGGGELAERFSRDLGAGPVTYVGYTPDDERLVVGARDAGVILDAASGDEVARLDGAEAPIVDAAVVDDEHLVIAGADDTIGVFDPDTGDKVRDIPREREVDGIDAWPGDLAVASGETVRVRDFGSGRDRFEVPFDHRVEQVRVSPDGRYLAASLAEPWVSLHLLRTEDVLALADERLTRSLTERECEEYFNGGAPCPGDG